MKREEDIILIAGPTASGKTAFAIDVAKASDAVILNADSMQVYRDLRVVTARPSEAEEAEVPHYGFGQIDAARAYSVTQWLDDTRQLIETNGLANRRLVFVGGTGLYFNALLEGLSPVPQIDPAVRERWREAASSMGADELYRALESRDAGLARMLEPTDRQRIIRGLEVIESTGKSLLEWQRQKGEPFFPPDTRFAKLLLMPDRKVVHERINRRFERMIGEGAVEEVQALLARQLDPGLPAMKAIGVPQLAAYLSGELALEDAIERAKAATRQYAKRQGTWFRNSFDDSWEQISG